MYLLYMIKMKVHMSVEWKEMSALAHFNEVELEHVEIYSYL